MKNDDNNVIGNPPATITGVLLWDSQVHFIKVRLPVLILNSFEWISELATTQEDLAEICDNVRESRQYARQAAILRTWLKNPIRPTTQFPALAMRQIWDRYHRVTERNFAEYISVILAVAERPGEYAQPEFLFCAHFAVPEIIVLPLFREVAAHTGPHFLGRVAGHEEIQTLVGRYSQQVLREAEDFRLKDGEEPPIE